ncbi:hypothetical protein KP509_05G055100 [Ceratopteris richardii]|uniref:Uncharacterized protein n=1 Tax=Ceratopteris richardii TaxID=49495 RepID=A0A8T2UTH4_CERRI|nr:hypothetical protein KP509_05G055100 [Ceratopteris richardii]
MVVLHLEVIWRNHKVCDVGGYLHSFQKHLQNLGTGWVASLDHLARTLELVWHISYMSVPYCIEGIPMTT